MIFDSTDLNEQDVDSRHFFFLYNIALSRIEKKENDIKNFITSLCFCIILCIIIDFYMYSFTCRVYGYVNISKLSILSSLTYYSIKTQRPLLVSIVSCIYVLFSILDIFLVFLIILSDDNIPIEKLTVPDHFNNFINPLAPKESFKSYGKVLRYLYQRLLLILSLPHIVKAFLQIILSYKLIVYWNYLRTYKNFFFLNNPSINSEYSRSIEEVYKNINFYNNMMQVDFDNLPIDFHPYIQRSPYIRDRLLAQRKSLSVKKKIRNTKSTSVCSYLYGYQEKHYTPRSNALSKLCNEFGDKSTLSISIDDPINNLRKKVKS